MTTQAARIELDDGIGLKVRDIVANFFSVDAGSITAATTADDVPGWDSTTHVGLILELEEALGIEFSVDQVADFDDVGELAGTCAALCEAG